jgi:hypothetical protein
MKRLILRDLTLASFKERRARKIRFDRTTTVVVGPNDTGKSALLKAIYTTFGALPPKVSDKWLEAQVASLIRFSVDEASFAILHHQGTYAVFEDEKTEPAQVFRSITNDLGPYLAALLDFDLRLPERESSAQMIPPPAFMFLPFYVDQDIGWTRAWSSFTRLQQFGNARKDVAEYHTGIRPNEYYKAKAERDQAKRALDTANAEVKALRGAQKKLEGDQAVPKFDLDITAFKQEIDNLLARCRELARIEDDYSYRAHELTNTRILRMQELSIAETALRETFSDYLFATNTLTMDSIDCPTCGAVYPNSFIERFAIARDQDRCRELIVTLEAELADISEAERRASSAASEAANERANLEELLAARQGDVYLQDVIDSASRIQIRSAFAGSVNSYTNEAMEHDRRVSELTRLVAQFTRSPRRKEILEFYSDQMKGYLATLEVRLLAPKDYQAIDTTLHTVSGSDSTRALLAYYYSILRTIERYGSAAYCPIVIDSPNQQGQDEVNLRNIIRFIFAERPADSQLILGVEDLVGNSSDGEIVELNQRFGLLQADDYASLEEEMWSRVRTSFRLLQES